MVDFTRRVLRRASGDIQETLEELLTTSSDYELIQETGAVSQDYCGGNTTSPGQALTALDNLDVILKDDSETCPLCTVSNNLLGF